MWCLTGPDQIARLSVHSANSRIVYDTTYRKKEELSKESGILKLDKRIIKRKLETSFYKTVDNIPMINDGRRTWEGGYLKTLGVFNHLFVKNDLRRIALGNPNLN